MITYFKLPLNDLKDIAQKREISLQYHPLKCTFIRNEKVIGSVEAPNIREKIIKFIFEWE